MKIQTSYYDCQPKPLLKTKQIKKLKSFESKLERKKQLKNLNDFDFAQEHYNKDFELRRLASIRLQKQLDNIR